LYPPDFKGKKRSNDTHAVTAAIGTASRAALSDGLLAVRYER